MAGLMDALRWPDDRLDAAEFSRQWRIIRPAFLERMRTHRLPEALADSLAAVYLPLATWLMEKRRKSPFVLGINGAQGSGKSTLCDFLALILTVIHAQRIAGFSIDDLYRTRVEREKLAREIHPLLITRGVPGTHDVALGLDTLRQLKTATHSTRTALPSFDKAQDDRRPERDWPLFRGRPDIIIFEGWCVGSRPQPDAALIKPVNDLERLEDSDGVWRRHVNAQLKADYAVLFAELDGLIFLKVPGMDRVFEWRSLQEQKLRESSANTGTRLMDADVIRRFIMHYERLTRHNLEELPERADLTLHVNEYHGFSRADVKAAAGK
jgi:D-glycerate 3-kinase